MSRAKKAFIIWLFAIVIYMFNIYGSQETLNAGITWGISESCQIGYEYKGDVGFFAYCNLK